MLTRNLIYFFLFIFCFSVTAIAQNDCSQALIVCGNGDYSNLDATGFGVQELNGSNNCSSQENNSLWLKLNIKTGGTLGFVLVPTSNDINVDFDFFVFGPTATCNNLGQAIRCSTTNPLASGASNNHTGMNAASADISEGPGADGNNYVKWLTVQAGETYFLVIDRPIGGSNFSLQWTGTATFHDKPVFNNPAGTPLDMHKCDNDNDRREDFDLDANTAMLLGSQAGATITYHRTENDAILGLRAIDASVPFPSMGQTIFVRIANTLSGCYDITDFKLFVDQKPVFTNPQNIVTDLQACDDDGLDDGIYSFDLLKHEAMFTGMQTNILFTVHRQLADAETGNNPITNATAFQNTANPQTLYYRMANTVTGCYATKPVTLSVKTIPVFHNPLNININLAQCDTDGTDDQKTSFDLTVNEGMFTGAQTDIVFSYHLTAADAQANANPIANPQAYTNTTSPQTIYVRMGYTTADCFAVNNFSIRVNPVPVFNNPNNIVLKIEECDADAVDDGSTVFNLTGYENMFKNNQTNIQFSYYLNNPDALGTTNAIATPAAFRNTSNPQTIYVRMQNTATGCFSITNFDVEVVNLLVAGQPGNLAQCDTNGNGLQVFNLAQNTPFLQNGNTATFATYYKTQADAQNQVNALPFNYQNAVPYTGETIWARLQNLGGCIGHDIKSFTITIYNIPQIDFSIQTTDFTVNDNSITVLMPNIQDYEFSLDDASYTDNPVFTGLESGIYTVYVRSKTRCKTEDKEVIILNYPRFFTPNGDGENDTWRVPYLQLYPGAEMNIFDRFGKLLHSFTSNSTGWDGTYNGKPLPSTDYWFVLKFGNNRIIKGHFAMLR